MAQASSQEHKWVGATHVDLALGQAKMAVHRGTIRVPEDTKVEVLEVYCSQCRRPFKAAMDTPCPVAEGREHLIGGPLGGVRSKRGPVDAATG